MIAIFLIFFIFFHKIRVKISL